MIEDVKDGVVLQKIIEDLTNNYGLDGHYTLEHGHLHYKGSFVISTTSPYISKLVAKYHTSPRSGHSRVFRTYKRVGQSLYWIGMKKMVTKFVAACLVYQKHKYLASTPQGQ